MFQKQKLYKRLPGKKTTSFSKKKIYMAEDHLLLVENYYYTESYSRFYYKDIKAIIAQENIKSYVYDLILIFLLLTAGEGMFVFKNINTVLGIFSAGIIILLIINITMGRTCKSFISTDIQIQELPVGRLKTLGKIINRIRPLIDKYQGKLDDEQMKFKIHELYRETAA